MSVNRIKLVSVTAALVVGTSLPLAASGWLDFGEMVERGLNSLSRLFARIGDQVQIEIGEIEAPENRTDDVHSTQAEGAHLDCAGTESPHRASHLLGIRSSRYGHAPPRSSAGRFSGSQL